MYINLHSLLPPNSDLDTEGLVEFYATDFGPTIGNKMSAEQFAAISLGSHAASVGKCTQSFLLLVIYLDSIRSSHSVFVLLL